MSKSAVVSAVGVVLSVVQGIMKETQKAGGGDEDFYLLSKPEGEDALRQIGQILTDLGKKVREICLLAVDYTRSLRDAVAAGRYDYVNENIKEDDFPAHEHEQGKKEVAFRLFHFNRYIESDEAIVEMDKQGFRPASLREMLVYREANSDLQRQFPIIALLSVWVDPISGRRSVPALWGSGLCLDDFGHRWSSHYRFLAVRKYQKKTLDS